MCVGLLALGRAAAVPALLFRNVIDKKELAPFKDDAKIADALAEQADDGAQTSGRQAAG